MSSRDRDAPRSVREVSFDYRKGPSFSSTLLEHIYKSIDAGDGDGHVDQDRCGMRKIQDKNFDDDVAHRAMLLDKWMLEKKKNKNVDVQNIYNRPPKKNTEPLIDKKLHYIDNDPLFFSSGSNSSDSNSSLFSDHDPIPVVLPTTKTRSSCFLPPKPIRTRENKHKKNMPSSAKSEHHHCNYETERDDDVPASTGSRALKLYSHFKKMKQPISPGVKLTTFINSILSKSNAKKHSSRESAAVNPTCSSAPRTFMTTTTPSSVGTNYSFKPSSVKLAPVNVKMKTDVEPSEPQLLSVKRDRPQLNRALNPITPTTKISVGRVSEDARSDCSEDLFELDHLKLRSISGNGGGLPVFETTRITSNRNHNNQVYKF